MRNNRLNAAVLIICLLFVLTVTAGAEEITVRVAEAKRESIKEVKVVSGEIIPYKNIRLPAKITGTVERINFRMGDRVEKGQTLIIFDREQLEVQVTQAEAGLEAAEANLARLKKGPDEKQIEASRAGIKQSEASLAVAEAQHEMLVKGATEEEIERAEASYRQSVASYEGAKRALKIIEEIYKDRTSLKQQLAGAEMQLKSSEKQWESARKRFEQSKVNLEQARNSLQQAEREYNRMRSLFEQDVVTEKQFEAAESQYKNAKLSVTNALSAVESSRIAMQQAEISYRGAQESYNLTEKMYNNPSQLKQQLDSARTQLEVAETNKEISKTNLEQVKKGARPEEIQRSQASVKQAQAALERAKANHAQLKQGASSEEIRASAANVKQAESSLKLARLRLEDAVVKSPVTGHIATVDVEEGVMVNPGTPLMSVVQLNPVYIKAEVSSRVLKNIKTGDRVQVSILDYKDEVKEGTIEMISPVRDQRSQSYPVKVLLDNEDFSLRGGMFADVHFTLARKNNSLVIPVDAVNDLDGEPYVYVAVNDKAVRRDISVGLVNNNRVEILNGIQEGENVIIQGQHSLRDGDSIEVVN